MVEISTKPGKWRAFGLVRDKHGRPKIKDINNIHPKIWDMLTDSERAVISKEIENG